MEAENSTGIGALIAFTLGWFIAQSAKLVLLLVKENKNLSFKDIWSRFLASGGMPSSHTASFIALSIYFGCEVGFDSNIFALAICTAVIVIYDAINVRFAVGEQGKLLNLMAVDSDKKYKKQRVVEGHTLPQVIAGGILGVIIGVSVAAAL